jgi:hypothetical protein
MDILKVFLKFFLIGLLIYSIFMGCCIGMYYAVITHWILGLAAVAIFGAIICGVAGVLISILHKK